VKWRYSGPVGLATALYLLFRWVPLASWSVHVRDPVDRRFRAFTTDFPPLLSMGDRVITDPAMRTIMGRSACASEGAHTTKSKACRHHCRCGVGMIADADLSTRFCMTLPRLGFNAYCLVQLQICIHRLPANDEGCSSRSNRSNSGGDRPSRHRTPTPATGRRVICRRVPLRRLRLRVSDGWSRGS
jgi:hypothetical protein